MGPERLGTVFIIVECPSADYVIPLVNNERYEPHYECNTSNPVSIIVHILGDGIIDHALYREWMMRFGESTQHIILDGKHSPKPIVFQKSALSLCRLNRIDSKIFDVPFYTTSPVPFDNIESLPLKISTAEPLQIYVMEPAPQMDNSELRPFNHLDPSGRVMKGFEKMGTFLDACTEVQSKSIAVDPTLNFPVKVFPLGTGASLPSKYRNVSSTYIYDPIKGGILLDGGEGTYGQLVRKFGGSSELSLKTVLCSLRLIFVSHMHADHHLGIFQVLTKRRQLLNGESTPLFIVGPPKYKTWLEEYSEIEDLGIADITFLSASSLLQVPDPSDVLISRFLEVSGFSVFKTVMVDHCPYAYACVMEHTEGWK
ncbi:hypothetical protein BC829DRAFT_238455 [Chytridium lagenaria]|nr:hypothetical protein BC829DRAFT_238455 [Chytridium lagenaria]